MKWIVKALLGFLLANRVCVLNNIRHIYCMGGGERSWFYRCISGAWPTYDGSFFRSILSKIITCVISYISFKKTHFRDYCFFIFNWFLFKFFNFTKASIIYLTLSLISSQCIFMNTRSKYISTNNISKERLNSATYFVSLGYFCPGIKIS